MTPSSLGQRITYYRKKNGISQIDLAAAAGVSHSTVSGYEKNKKTPSVPVLQNLAKTLNVTVDALLGLESPENASESNVLRAYRNLNAPGRDRVLEYIAFLEESPKFNPNIVDNSSL